MKKLFILSAAFLAASFVSPMLQAQDGNRAGDAAAKLMFGKEYQTDAERREATRLEKSRERAAQKRAEEVKKANELYRKPLIDKLNATLDNVDASRIRIVIEADKSNSTEIEFEKVTDENEKVVLQERNK